MFEYIASFSAFSLFVIFCCGSIAVSVIAILLIKQFVPEQLQYKDNPVIGNISALISIIYGVLAGLTALYLINNINYTDDAIQREANAAANLYRDSQWLPEPHRGEVATQIKIYLTEAINTEWPLMKAGKKITPAGNLIIDKIAHQVYLSSNHAESILAHDMLDEVKTLYNARQQRIHMSSAFLHPAIWVVILIGTILTIAINYLFGMNIYLHLITVIASALMASSMIFLLVTLDRPFQGEFVIEPDALQAILTTIKT
jgi:hypothetical protein